MGKIANNAKEYEVTISYTTYQTFTVTANNAEGAVDKAIMEIDDAVNFISYVVEDESGVVDDGMF